MERREECADAWFGKISSKAESDETATKERRFEEHKRKKQ